MEKQKHILIIDLALFVGSLLVLSGFFVASHSDQQVVLSPTLGERDTLFSINGKATKIFASRNLEFDRSFAYGMSDGLQIVLTPGTYYWKVENDFSDEVRKIVIEEETVVLELRKVGDVYEVVNSGNKDLNVAFSRYGEHEGNFIFRGGNNE